MKTSKQFNQPVNQHYQYLLKLATEQDLAKILPAHICNEINNIQVLANLTLIGKKLVLNFEVIIPQLLQSTPQIPKIKDRLQTKVEWQDFDNNHIERKDFLWESTCLECFVGNTNCSEYVEINASPAGNFAVYHFDDYRKPDCLPPRTLQTPDNQSIKVDWSREQAGYQRRFSVDLTLLPPFANDKEAEQPQINLINPTAILYLVVDKQDIQEYKHEDKPQDEHQDKQRMPLFFAHTHATPADFHNQSCWINLTQ